MSWKLQEEQEGDKYYYTVGVKGSPYKELQHSSPETSCKYDEKQFTESESELESFSQTKLVTTMLWFHYANLVCVVKVFNILSSVTIRIFDIHHAL